MDSFIIIIIVQFEYIFQKVKLNTYMKDNYKTIMHMLYSKMNYKNNSEYLQN